jgi:hypothetical protein
LEIKTTQNFLKIPLEENKPKKFFLEENIKKSRKIFKQISITKISRFFSLKENFWICLESKCFEKEKTLGKFQIFFS